MNLEKAFNSGLSHVSADGSARMVDVGAKPETARYARAIATVVMQPATASAVAQANGPKGDVIGPARMAGIMAAKRTSDLIPLCHPLPLSFVDVTIDLDVDAGRVTVRAEARTTGRTGVEMEAMTACAVASLTVYDMVKGVEKGVVIEQVALEEKTGGKAPYQRVAM